MNLFRKIFHLLKFEKYREEKRDNFLLLSELFDTSTPIYLVDEKFNFCWGNKAFHKFVHNVGTKCYQTIFGSKTVCLNCPAPKTLRTKEAKESFVSFINGSNNNKVFKVTSLPLVVENKVYALNFINLIEFDSSETLSKDKIVLHLKESFNDDNFLNFLEQFPFPILILDQNFNIQFANGIASKEFNLLNLKENNINLRSLFNSLGTPDFEQLILNILNNNIQSFRVSCESGVDSKKKVYDCKIFKTMYDSEFYILICKASTESDFGNELSGKSFEFIEKVFDKLKLGVLLQDGFNRAIFQNKVAKDLLDNNDELINQIILNKSLASKNTEINFKYNYTKDGGKIYNVRINDFNLEDSFEKYELVEFEDITELETLKVNFELTKKQIEPIEKNIRFVSFELFPDMTITNVFGKLQFFDFVKPDQVRKRNFIEDFVYPEDSFKVSELLSELFHFPNITRTHEFRLKATGSDYLWVKGFFENVVDERGKILNVKCLLLDINEQKKVEEQLKASQEEMRNLALYFESLREDEKKKLAFEIHDELGHLLTAMKLEMAWLLKKKHLREDVLNEKLLKLTEMVETTIRKVRSISSQLRPSILDHFGIVAAIEWQAKEFQRQTAIRCRINLPKQELQLDEQKSIVVFRVFQEILTNIARHAKATRVDVNLVIDDNYLNLIVSDNGKGIKPEDISAKKSLGIIGMKERATSVNGKLTIHGVSNIGTTVTLTIPIK